MKKYILKIEVAKNQIKLELSYARKEIDKIIWQDENNLSLTLLKNIDQLLKKNKIDKREIKKIQTKFNQAGYSSERIVKINELAGNFYLTNF